MRKSFIPISIAVIFLLFLSTNSMAIETAPRISDRELIEKLSALDAKIDRVDAKIDKEIANVRGDIKELKAGQKALEQQFADVKDGQKTLEGRIDNLIFAVLGCFVALMGSFAALMGFVIWDRRTTLAPAVRKNRELEEREDKVEKALKEYARKEPKLAEILRNVGIM